MWPVVFRSLSLVPAVYVFVAIQYSAITVPFWDHIELINYIAAWYDGTFQVASLWAPHNHTRPLVYRGVMLLNALATNWDIRSEYVYVYAAIYGTFICHVWVLSTLSKDGDQLIPSSALLMISLLLFSPAGHNNHWWSMMFQLNVANLLITFSLLTTSFYPYRWVSHIAAATSCWLAAYSLTNGLIAFVSLALTFQVCAQNPMRPNRWSVFWFLNLAAVLILYLPGLHWDNGPRPSIGELIWFSMAYLGAPLGSIIWFPFKGQFDIPISTLMNGGLGSLLVVSALLLIWYSREEARCCQPAALLLVECTLFSLGSAVVTAWGRAHFDDYGISNANSSRYTIFGVYLLVGIIYFICFGLSRTAAKERVVRGHHPWGRGAVIVGTLAFIVFGMITYVRGAQVYVDAHNFNRMLTNAFPWGLEPTGLEKYVHHKAEAVMKLKSAMQRWQLGPYASMPLSMQTFSIGTYRRQFLLFDGRRIMQRFRANAPGLKAIAVTMTTDYNKHARYHVVWQVHDVTSDDRRLVGSGIFDTRDISDWQSLRLQLPFTAGSSGHLYELELSSEGKVDERQSVGPALYSLTDDQSGLEQATGSDEISSEPLTLALRLEYAK